VSILRTLLLGIDTLNAYKDEMKLFSHLRSIKAIESLSYNRGASSVCGVAEAFIIGRKIK